MGSWNLIKQRWSLCQAGPQTAHPAGTRAPSPHNTCSLSFKTFICSSAACFLHCHINSQLLKGSLPSAWTSSCGAEAKTGCTPAYPDHGVPLHSAATVLVCPKRASSSSTCQSDLGGVVKIKLRMKKRLIIISSKENHFKRIFRLGTCEHLEVPGFGLTKARALRHACVWVAVCRTRSIRWSLIQ